MEFFLYISFVIRDKHLTIKHLKIKTMKNLETKNFPNLPGHIGDLFVNALNQAINDGYVFDNEEVNTVYEDCVSSITVRRQELLDTVETPTEHWTLLISIIEPNLAKLFKK
jgi:hypothetical protein